jgi:hypothetical protein
VPEHQWGGIFRAESPAIYSYSSSLILQVVVSGPDPSKTIRHIGRASLGGVGEFAFYFYTSMQRTHMQDYFGGTRPELAPYLTTTFPHGEVLCVVVCEG